MTVFADAVCEGVSGTPGTGTITLSGTGAALGDGTTGRTFAAALGANSDTKIRIVEGTTWEICDSTYTHSGTTLSRGTLRSSSTGSRVAFTSAAKVFLVSDAATANALELAMQGVMPGGRLTLTSATPVTTSDVTGATTIYYAEYVSNVCPLWDGSRWLPVTFSNKSKALGTLTSGRPYDVFAYLNAGALDLEFLAWTSDTTRATAVTIQDGRYCKSGDKTRLLLGTFYTTSTTTTEDSSLWRFVSNVYNRVNRNLMVQEDSLSHTYTTASWREWNNGVSVFRPQFVATMPLTFTVSLQFCGNRSSGGGFRIGNIGFDAADGSIMLLSNMENASASGMSSLSGSASPAAAAGKHFLTAVEFGQTSTTYDHYNLQASVPC